MHAFRLCHLCLVKDACSLVQVMMQQLQGAIETLGGENARLAEQVRARVIPLYSASLIASEMHLEGEAGLCMRKLAIMLLMMWVTRESD